MDALEAAEKHLQSCEKLAAEQRERIAAMASHGKEVDAARHALVTLEQLVDAAKARRDQILLMSRSEQQANS